jgi:hypothetical protein
MYGFCAHWIYYFMQKGGFAPLKRFLCAVIVAALLLFCVACGSHAACRTHGILIPQYSQRTYYRKQHRG